ncbi:kinase-like domain-containing protein [Thelonectria olida]|uniref:Kinase-like domain-containing protein n=1 Tax=Thelonectria olida TaxID=1576542 RepID=A0A9P9AN12_9HYPO|nr:kinase-like domain-containing protein [Thelonectria olida]
MTSLIKGPAAPRGVFDSDKPLPLIPEDISAAWLSEVLEVEVKDFEITSIDHGTSSKIFVTLVFEEGVETDIPTRVCVKGGFNPVIRQVYPEMLATYRREAEFYYHIAPLTRMLLPRTWFCGSDTVNGQGIVIMSNVADECTFGTPLKPWSPSRVEGALKQLASLHGKTWNSDEKDYPWLFGKDGEKLANPVRNIVLALLRPEPWAIRFDEKCRPPVAEFLLDRERIQRGFEALWKHADSDLKFYSLIHGDNHIGNTLITNDGTPGFIDWQGLQYGPAILDLVYFLTGALTVEDRRNHEKLLVESYLEALHAEGGPKLSKEDVWDDYRRYAMQGFLWSMTPSNMQPDNVIFAISERYSAAIVDHQTLELLGV